MHRNCSKNDSLSSAQLSWTNTCLRWRSNECAAAALVHGERVKLKCRWAMEGKQQHRLTGRQGKRWRRTDGRAGGRNHGDGEDDGPECVRAKDFCAISKLFVDIAYTSSQDLRAKQWTTSPSSTSTSNSTTPNQKLLMP
uniref:Uncharacterized protein n=1 Tax=Globodera rostochiensis TaxID=31243 RepID=A0A914I3U9_GLORO